MGFCQSQPLQKVKNKDGFELSAGYSTNSARISGYHSITSFILQNENPVMYDWAFKAEIGTGSMSHVFKVENVVTGEEAAAKVYSLSLLKRKSLSDDEMPIVSVQREIDIMSELRHRYILKIIDVFEDDPTKSLLIITEFAKMGSVQTIYENHSMTKDMTVTCFFQVAEAMAYAHSKNIVHRDIKPDNMLAFSETYFVLSDFSVSTKLKTADERLSDTKGSPAFLSPEECATGDFEPKPADVWAYGVSLYFVLFNALPFSIGNDIGSTTTTAMQHVSQNLEKEELTFPEDADPSAVALLKKILSKDPHERPTFEQIKEDPFFEVPQKLDAKILKEKDLITSIKYTDTSEGSFRIE